MTQGQIPGKGRRLPRRTDLAPEAALAGSAGRAPSANLPPRGAGSPADQGLGKRPWTFLTNHAHVLICIADEPNIRGRDIAARVGITERAAQAIIADLVASGYVRRRRDGRRNHYSVDPDGPMRHPLDYGHTVGDIFAALGHLLQSGLNGQTRGSETDER